MKNNNLIFFENKHAFKIHFKTKLYRDSPEIPKQKARKYLQWHSTSNQNIKSRFIGFFFFLTFYNYFSKGEKIIFRYF
jgi:hypothetical protein